MTSPIRDTDTQNPAGTLILVTAGLLSKYGFCDGDPFFDDGITDWFHAQHADAMGRCDCSSLDLGVPDADLLRLLVRRYMVPALDQRVEVIDVETSHNPIRAAVVNGVNVEDCWAGKQPAPSLTPAIIAIPYADVLAAVEELRADGSRCVLDTTKEDR